MAETTKPDLSYTCPNCGQKALIGTHFCRTIPDRDPLPDPPQRRGNGKIPGLFSLMGGFLVLLLLWRLTGPAALVLAALGLGAWLLWKRLGKRR